MHNQDVHAAVFVLLALVAGIALVLAAVVGAGCAALMVLSEDDTTEEGWDEQQP